MQKQHNGFNEHGEPELAAVAFFLFIMALGMVAAKSVGVSIGHHLGWLNAFPHDLVIRLIGHPL